MTPETKRFGKNHPRENRNILDDIPLTSDFDLVLKVYATFMNMFQKCDH